MDEDAPAPVAHLAHVGHLHVHRGLWGAPLNLLASSLALSSSATHSTCQGQASFLAASPLISLPALLLLPLPLVRSAAKAAGKLLIKAAARR